MATELLMWSVSALVAIWIGYPIAIALLGLAVRGARAANGHEPVTPEVSVLIATRDSAESVEKRVSNAMATNYPAERLQVVVACDHGLDIAVSIESERDARVVVVRGDSPGGKAASLNAAVRASRGAVLVFTDVAQRFELDTIPRLVGALERDPRLGAVSGCLEVDATAAGGAPRTLASVYWRMERWLREREARLHSAVGVTGAVYAMRRECWEPLRPGLILDDVYGPMRIAMSGWRVGFTRDAVAHDDRRFAPAQELKRKARTLTGVFQLCWWLPAVLNPLRNPIWLQFVFHKLLRLATPYLFMVATLAGMVLAGRALVAAPPAVIAVSAVAAVVVLAIAWRTPRIADAIRMAVAMQVAVVRATINGMRGDWDVWAR